MTVNELIEELLALRDTHRCGDMDVVGVERTWDGCDCLPEKECRKDDRYDHDPVPLVRPRFRREMHGAGTRVVELAPEPSNG